MRVPDFICVGAQKAGTTWLYEQISRHPQVFMHEKEIDFFFKSLDLSWYSKIFADAPETQLCGDISPNYAAFIGLARRIHQFCPSALVIHLLRDPVDRAFSQWKMARDLNNIPYDMSFLDAFNLNLQYMKRRGEYVEIIDEYDNFYPLEKKSAVFWFDDIRTKPRELMRSIMDFLGIDSSWESPLLNEVIYASPDKTRPPQEAVAEILDYYAPFDDRLRSRLGIRCLPWDVPGNAVDDPKINAGEATTCGC